MQPEITVLMSCYNAEQWLAEAIDSVLTQTHQNFEFILVDDGSKDNTLNLLRKYEKLDHRIKVIAKANTGLPDSLNVGIFQAKGTWIARLDADDICEPSRLEQQLDFVNKNPQVVLLGTGFSQIDVSGQIVKIHQYPTDNAKLISRLEHFKSFFAHSSAFYHTATVKILGGYRPRIRFAEDWDLWLRLSEKGQLASLTEPLVRIRKHANQISLDESGTHRKQLIDGLFATISYFIRKYGSDDPVRLEDDREWQQFASWVEKKVDEDGLLKRYQFWTTTRQKLSKQEHKLVQAFSLLRSLTTVNYNSALIKEKIFGSDLPKHLAKEWCRNHT